MTMAEPRAGAVTCSAESDLDSSQHSTTMLHRLSLSDRIRLHPILTYFGLAYAISWAGALAIAAPRLMRGESIHTMDVGVMFLFMLLGPSATGVILTRIV